MQALETQQSENPRQARAKILLVDDQPINIRLLHELLRTDYDLFMANDGTSAIRKCQELLPDLVLLDVVMPGMDGYEVCQYLKSDPITANIPIIFITAQLNETDEVKGFEMGAADFIRKPINPVITQMRVRNQLQLKQQADLLRTIALKDGLTGIANRRQFDLSLQSQWQHCARFREPLSLLMLDVDFFKRYNDTYGHQQGDACLRKIAQTVQHLLQRPMDLAARYGGEEFAVILPHTHTVGAKHVAQKILRATSDLQLPHTSSSVGPYVTLSIGVATTIPAAACEQKKLVLAADKQLYAAKAAGRGQVFAEDLNQ